MSSAANVAICENSEGNGDGEKATCIHVSLYSVYNLRRVINKFICT